MGRNRSALVLRTGLQLTEGATQRVNSGTAGTNHQQGTVMVLMTPTSVANSSRAIAGKLAGTQNFNVERRAADGTACQFNAGRSSVFQSVRFPTGTLAVGRLTFLAGQFDIANGNPTSYRGYHGVPISECTDTPVDGSGTHDSSAGRYQVGATGANSAGMIIWAYAVSAVRLTPEEMRRWMRDPAVVIRQAAVQWLTGAYGLGTVIDLSGRGNHGTHTSTTIASQSLRLPGRRRRVFMFGETFTLSAGGTVTPTGALVRATTHPLTASVAPAGALTRAVGKAPSGTLAPAGATAWSVGKGLAASIGLSGAIAWLRPLLFTGDVSASGALTALKTALLSADGTVTPVGTVRRDIAANVTGSVAPAGSLMKGAATRPSGSVGIAGAVVNLVSKGLSGAPGISGALQAIKTALLDLAGDISFAGALTRQTQATSGGTVTSSGSLVKASATRPSGTVGIAGALARLTAHTWSGSVGPTGALQTVKVVLLTFSGLVSSAGAMFRERQSTIGAVITAAGTLARGTSKSFSGFVAPAGSLARSIARLVSGAITLVGAWLGEFVVPTATRIERIETYHMTDAAVSFRLLEPIETLVPTGRAFISWSET